MQYQPAMVVRNQEYGPGHWVIEFKTDDELPEIRAGQFLSLRCDPHDQNSLLRPFSFLDANAITQTFSVYYKHLGRMSTNLSEFGEGTQLDVLYPLGQPFPWHEDWRRVAIVGGGVGLAPLLMLANEMLPYGEHMQVEAFFGGRTQDDLVPELLKDYSMLTMRLATDDGSVGHHGTVVDLLQHHLHMGTLFDVVYICGPNPMMKALQEVIPKGMEAYASLEEYMACGVGACLGCTAHIEIDGEQHNIATCKDGPVFPLHQVVFEQ